MSDTITDFLHGTLAWMDKAIEELQERRKALAALREQVESLTKER